MKIKNFSKSKNLSKILGIQTSTFIWSVALINEEKILGEYTFDSYGRLSKILVPSIDELLSKTGIKKEEIEGIAVAKGPGLFTGTRMGMSVAKGLSIGLDIPVVGISILDALAFNLSYCTYPICALISSRGQDVFSALYKVSNRGFKKIEKESVLDIQKRLKKIRKPTIFIGEAAIRYKVLIKKKLGKSAIFAPLALNYIRASDIAFQARGKMSKAGKLSSLNLKAQYLRPGVDPIRSPAN
ncbi:MAG: tRNA (adenosine(37)-N6)-threonylcarbamoyltransferase complex dimerization subunit type 1 TsaB [Candidatus Omnitrophica bacterium]|nr:tRNA (adenosine(37)-N6)-threonylcarbamoyltransferase complex dimerization subunit type 1 TsaB [Candidatus Omnitrophota bacterium]MBU1047578.1 tRNA (adenosine(37)-N6)-threonylcarbamoyltransferase complex dimerization subunit type 1 TsaB [Candidatus Omnitrophota bacterium]MBU1630322.1 tRNA (adenosine(37)-N6)-threonylcarbamoyltransferase complex dimerization subunit type 1 TsaB [Candidatus Omnitrophota bacterium]MBU1766991.1 tRNA (adenosine(37)-N6)-threonylcarbamoyltransferase complex dimerizati